MKISITPGLLADVKAFLRNCGFKQLTFYPLQQQLAGYVNHGETSHEILVDFKEGKVSLSTLEKSDVLSYEAADWQTIQQACERVIELAKKRGILGETSPT